MKIVVPENVVVRRKKKLSQPGAWYSCLSLGVADNACWVLATSKVSEDEARNERRRCNGLVHCQRMA